MIVLMSEERGASGALAHYQIIRRNGAVLPFEPSKIAAAMMKAFLAVHGTLADRERRKPFFEGLILSFFEQVSGWRCQIRLFALDSKRAMLAQGIHARRNVGTVVCSGAGAGRGFFSATKPNLRNAP